MTYLTHLTDMTQSEQKTRLPAEAGPPVAWKAIALPNKLLPFKKLERKTRLELATYSLEGYRSTKWATSAYLLYKELWAEKDSNLRTPKRTDLQSVAFNHSAICPIFTEPKKGVEPPTCWLQISCSTNWATSAKKGSTGWIRLRGLRVS